jgi:hypothetical protein
MLGHQKSGHQKPTLTLKLSNMVSLRSDQTDSLPPGRNAAAAKQARAPNAVSTAWRVNFLISSVRSSMVSSQLRNKTEVRTIIMSSLKSDNQCSRLNVLFAFINGLLNGIDSVVPLVLELEAGSKDDVR